MAGFATFFVIWPVVVFNWFTDATTATTTIMANLV